ncbi:MAG: 4Fe-4S binding protein, partial [bacterium]|nr:4Fe-4S binding protein [bacterium]
EANKVRILFAFLLNPLRVNENGLILQQMTLGERDKTGRCQPVPTESLIFIKTDKIITAIGEERGNSFLNPVLFENQEEEGIFIGGDALYGPGFVSKAIASGKEASLKIRRYLGENINTDTLPSSAAPPKIIELKDLNLEYFEQQRKNGNPEEEVKRCFSCGLCPQNPEICSNCWKFCPDAAVEIRDNKSNINYDYCKGCLICKHECPRGAIDFREGK